VEVDAAADFGLGRHLLLGLDEVSVDLHARFVGQTYHVFGDALLLGVGLGRVEEAEDQRLLAVYSQDLDDNGVRALAHLLVEDLKVVPGDFVVDLLEHPLVEDGVPNQGEVVALEGVFFVDEFLVLQRNILVDLGDLLDFQLLLLLQRLDDVILVGFGLHTHLVGHLLCDVDGLDFVGGLLLDRV